MEKFEIISLRNFMEWNEIERIQSFVKINDVSILQLLNFIFSFFIKRALKVNFMQNDQILTIFDILKIFLLPRQKAT